MTTASSGGGGTGGGGQRAGSGVPPSSPLSARVAFLPLLACCLDPGLFVLPAASSAARRAVAGGVAAGFAPLESGAGDAAAQGEGASGGLSLTAHGLLALAAAMGAPRPEPYAIGPVSSALAAEMASLPSVSVSVSMPPGSLAAPTSAASSGSAAAGGLSSSSSSSSPSSSSLAIILIDRSLDLASPCSHTDHPWDLLLAAAAARQAKTATRRRHRRSRSRSRWWTSNAPWRRRCWQWWCRRRSASGLAAVRPQSGASSTSGCRTS
ncbi:hypothetical protein Vretimale_11217 [Volvox reticuliferus]|uniref:Uncharacterized protein n=1 Tax=Volvox reticuliferus TaxID=1737510 RepID=A0A8J4LQP6_9CHLO|nr:hypothetical protein Vretimale_11217 [Volvox reticuliferus]